MRVLRVEGDTRQAEFICCGLGRDGACIDHAADSEPGYAMSIIRNHGGNIDVTSAPGVGTFTLQLPL